jgi:hypothetical protein
MSVTTIRRSASLAIIGAAMALTGACKDMTGPADFSQTTATPQAGSIQLKPSSARTPTLLPESRTRFTRDRISSHRLTRGE